MWRLIAWWRWLKTRLDLAQKEEGRFVVGVEGDGALEGGEGFGQAVRL